MARSNVVFGVNDALQQGTFNTSILFNLYFSRALSLFHLNSDFNLCALVFVNGLLIDATGMYSSNINFKLQQFLERIMVYCGN